MSDKATTKGAAAALARKPVVAKASVVQAATAKSGQTMVKKTGEKAKKVIAKTEATNETQLATAAAWKTVPTKAPPKQVAEVSRKAGAKAATKTPTNVIAMAPAAITAASPFDGKWLKQGGQAKYVIEASQVRFLDDNALHTFEKRKERKCAMILKGTTFEGSLTAEGSIQWANGSVWVRDSHVDSFDGAWIKVGTTSKFIVTGAQVKSLDGEVEYKFVDKGGGACAMDLNGNLIDGKLTSDGRIQWANASHWVRDQPIWNGEWAKMGAQSRFVVDGPKVTFMDDGNQFKFTGAADGSCTMDINGGLFKGKLLADGKISWASGSFWHRCVAPTAAATAAMRRPSLLTATIDGRWQNSNGGARYNILGDSVQFLADFAVFRFTKKGDATCAMQLDDGVSVQGKLTAESRIEWEDGSAWAKEVVKAPLQIVPQTPMATLQAWAPEAREYQLKIETESRAQTLRGRDALVNGRRRAVRQMKDLRTGDLNDLDPNELRPDDSIAELSDVDSECSADSISGDVTRSWNPSIRDERYRFARDRAVAFSESWSPLAWTHERWFKHLSDQGTLKPDAVILPPKPKNANTVKKKKTANFEGHWVNDGEAKRYIVEASKLYVLDLEESGKLLPAGADECLMEIAGDKLKGKLDSAGSTVKWEDGSVWLKTEGFDGFWKEQGANSKYIIKDENLQILDLGTTVDFIRYGFSCTIDVSGITWNGQIGAQGRLTWDNGSVWVRDLESDEEELDCPEDRQAKIQAKLQREREARKRERGRNEAVTKVREAMSKVPELGTVPMPTFRTLELMKSVEHCGLMTRNQFVWEEAQANQSRRHPAAGKHGWTTRASASLESPGAFVWPLPPGPSTRHVYEACPWRDYTSELTNKVWI